MDGAVGGMTSRERRDDPRDRWADRRWGGMTGRERRDDHQEEEGYLVHGRTFPLAQAVKYAKLASLSKMPICIPWIKQEAADFVYPKTQRFLSYPNLCKYKVLFRKMGYVFWGTPSVPGIYIALHSPFCECLVPVLDLSMIKIAWRGADADSFYITSWLGTQGRTFLQNSRELRSLFKVIMCLIITMTIIPSYFGS